MLHLLTRIRFDELGEVAVSYSLVAALVSIAALVGMALLGDILPEIYNFVTGTMIEGLERGGV